MPTLSEEQILNLVFDAGTGSLKIKANIDVGDIAIGAVELKDAGADVRAKIAALNTLAAGDVGLGVHDPVLQAALIAAFTDGSARVGGTVDVSDRAGRAAGIVSAADGGLATLGALADAEVAGAGAASAIAVLKRLRTLLNGGLPAALAAGGGFKVEGVAGGVSQPVDSELAAALAGAEGMANQTTAPVHALMAGFNGTTWDRWRNIVRGTTIGSAARTSTTNSSDVDNYNARGIMFYFRATAGVTATDNITVKYQMRDPFAGNYQTIASFAPITAVADWVYVIFPGASDSKAEATVEAQDLPAPATSRLQVVHATGASVTYGAAHLLIP